MSREGDSKTSEEDLITPTHSERKRSINSDDHSQRSAGLKRPRLDLQNKEFKDRGKRMLGMIFNTLNQFKKDTNEKTEAEKRREEIENKLQARLRKEKKELEEEIKQDDELKKRIRKEREKQRSKELRDYCNKINRYKANFIKTKATPYIYYLPAKLNEETKKILEEQKSETLKKISLNTEPDDLMSPSTISPLSAKSDNSDVKEPIISSKNKEEEENEEKEEKDRSLSPVDKESKKTETDDATTTTATKKKEEAKQDVEIEEGEVNEGGDGKEEKISNENSKMSDQSNEEEEEEVDDAMDEVQY